MKTDLLNFADKGGCSAKLPPLQLEKVLASLPLPVDPSILVNIDTHDDAGVYRINDELALVLTTDFFPPVCSDPFEYGQIAAANAISDVYAMGGDPILALNIMMFPAGKLPLEVYGEILKGGYDKATEAGVRIIGGHTIDDDIPKYGLSVTGFVNPGRIVTNSGARPGDRLILTKRIGTGVVLAAHRLGLAPESMLEPVLKQMKQLNNGALAAMKEYGIKGATDITGFGLAGHSLKMAKASDVSIVIEMEKVPLLDGVLYLTDEGCIPGACFTNLEFSESNIHFGDGLPYNLKMTAFDAQTSGGMLICAPGNISGRVTEHLLRSGVEACEIGSVREKDEKYLYLE